MKRLALVLAVLSLATLARPARADEAPAAPAALALGASAPLADVKLKNVDERELTLAASAGKKGLLVVFTCNHCPWVKMWQTRIAAIGNAAVAKGIGVVAINANDPAAYPEDAFAEMRSRAKQLGFRFPYAVDETSDVARAFGATRTPEAFLFDAQGRLVYHGTVDDNARDEKAVKSRWLRDAVDAVAAGRAPKTAETKALGCSIKFREKSAS